MRCSLIQCCVYTHIQVLVNSALTIICHPVLFLGLARPISLSLVRYTHIHVLSVELEDIHVLCPSIAKLNHLSLSLSLSQSLSLSHTHTGDVMSPPDLDHLLVLPHGCGEQNMVRFSLNVVTGLYLVHTKQLSDILAVKIRNNLQTGNVHVYITCRATIQY